MMLKHLIYIDFIKGFAILLVVMGHCIQFSTTDYDHNILFRFIYSFHMPLFMCVSGFVSYKPILSGAGVIKRAKQLLIPFFSWPLVYGLLNWKSFYWKTYPNIILNPDSGGLWFLWVLFFISALFYLFYIISKKLNCKIDFISGLLILSLSGVYMSTHFDLFGFQFIAWYSLFYWMGYIMHEHIDIFTPYLKKGTFIYLPLFIFFASFWMRKEVPSFLGTSSSLMLFIYKFWVAVLGILCVFSVSIQYLNNIDYSFIKNICKIGKETLGIYAIHYLFVSLFLSSFSECSYWPMITISFILTSVCSYLSVQALKRNKYASFYLLGKRHQEK